ncbi:hypothetical protein BO71DRAFT_398851 [Aspergillus ellipticus CBS 707.79]|uniref:Cupin type-2 domain-containing protein n=1 Tax=Aspergillus ellipticus CBS 707.79 TaxID=1448320 RepID=A0A319DK55_9EURO|nr:hypothetical protein BO71DRAFT_398851 [Aspergillus ellipticus CBS 707.79]
MSEYHPLPHLAPVRRVVTGHTPQGKAIFSHDDQLQLVNPRPIPADTDPNTIAGFSLIHRTHGYPVDLQGPESELSNENLARAKMASGDIISEIVDIPPGEGQRGAAYLHRNHSLEYGVILKGSVQLILDDGVEKTLSEGDVFVQRGTMHGWKNVTDQYCRFMAVIIPSNPAKTGAGEELPVTKIPGLTD